MSTSELNTPEDAEMPECDGEKVVTMMDVLQEQQDFEEDANAVLGASDDKDCTYSKGYIKRQAIYACLTCCADARVDSTKRAGVCLACSLTCHENHELIELYTKRNFRCDCGNPKFNSHPCQFVSNKTELNEENNYNQNFSGLYCICHRPYPDPDAAFEDEMIQCIICEDWLHASHLDATVPGNDQYSEMICKACMEKNEFLHDYSSFAITAENLDVDVTSFNDSVSKSQINEVNTDLDSVETQNSIKVAFENVHLKDNDSEKNDKNMNSDSEINKKSENDITDFSGEKVVNENKNLNDTSTDKDKDEKIHNIDMKESEINPNLLETNEKTKLTDVNMETKDTNDENINDLPRNTPANTDLLKDENEEQVVKENVTKELESKENQPEEQTNSKEDENPTLETKSKLDITVDKKDTENSIENTNVEEIMKLNPDTTSLECVGDNIDVKINDEEDNASKESKKGTMTEDTPIETAENKEKTECKKYSSNDVSNIEKNNILTETESTNTELQDTGPPVPSVDSEKINSIQNESTLELNNESNNVNQKMNEETNMKLEKNMVHYESVSAIPKHVNVDAIVMSDIKKAKEIDHSNKENKTPSEISDLKKSNEKKRKTTIEESEEEQNVKKQKVIEDKICVRPRGVKRQYKGATFWPSSFRSKLCTCNECLTMYKDLSVMFLIDPDDTVTAYETLGKEKTDGKPASQYEKGLQALSSLDRIQQINALTEYNKMRDKLLDFLKSFKDRKEIVKEEDIKAFFAGMKPKREPDGVYFCR